MNAMAYLRVSSEEQARNGIVIDAQKVKIEELAKEKKLKIDKWYVDQGISGSL